MHSTLSISHSLPEGVLSHTHKHTHPFERAAADKRLPHLTIKRPLLVPPALAVAAASCTAPGAGVGMSTADDEQGLLLLSEDAIWMSAVRNLIAGFASVQIALKREIRVCRHRRKSRCPAALRRVVSNAMYVHKDLSLMMITLVFVAASSSIISRFCGSSHLSHTLFSRAYISRPTCGAARAGAGIACAALFLLVLAACLLAVPAAART